MSENAGYATLQIIPSMKGFGDRLKTASGREVDKAGESSGKRFSSGFMGGVLGGAVVSGLVVLGSKIKQFGSGAVDVFSEVEDATGAAGVVFGKSVGDITKFAATADKKYGLAQGAALNAALSFGTLGKAAGKQGPALSDFSTQMSGLAGDLASFRGTSTEQAVEAIGAALRGEMEPIRAYGVLLDDATLRNQALKMGLIKTTKDALTPQNKTLAAQAAILAQTKDAQGDFARTSDSTANTQKRLQAATENAQAALGAKLAPALTLGRTLMLKGIEAATGFIGTVSNIGSSMKDAFAAGAEWESHSPFETVAVGARIAYDAGKALWDLLIGGDFTGAFAEIFGVGEDSALVDFLFDLRETAITVFGEVVGGIKAFAAAWKFNDGEVTSSGFPGFMERLGYVVRQVADFIVGTLIPGIASLAVWLYQNRTAVAVVAGIIGAVLLPVIVVLAAQYVALGVMAVRSSIKQVVSWVTTRAAAVKSAAQQLVASYRVVAGWVVMGVQSLIQAGRMAAAWFIALGPIGWAIAAVIAVVAIIIANWDKVKAWTIAAWSAVSGAVVSAWEWITSTLSGIASTVGGWLATLGGIMLRVVSAFTFPIRLALAIAVTLMLAGWELIKAPVLAAVAFIGGIIRFYFNTYSAIIRTALAVITAVVGKVWGWIKSVFAANLAVVRSIVSTGIGWVTAGFNKLSALASIVGGFFGRIVSAVNGKIAELVSAAKGIAGKVLGAIGDFERMLFDKGADIVSGLIKGIGSMGSKLAGFVKQFIKDHIPAPVAKALKIASPSKVMAAQAKWIPLGIVQGIESQRHVLDRTMSGLVRDPGLPALDRSLISGDRSGSARPPVQVDVHPSPDMDEYELATKTVRAIEMAGV